MEQTMFFFWKRRAKRIMDLPLELRLLTLHMLMAEPPKSWWVPKPFQRRLHR
jgi:hypothetical protein